MYVCIIITHWKINIYCHRAASHLENALANLVKSHLLNWQSNQKPLFTTSKVLLMVVIWFSVCSISAPILFPQVQCFVYVCTRSHLWHSMTRCESIFYLVHLAFQIAHREESFLGFHWRIQTKELKCGKWIAQDK